MNLTNLLSGTRILEETTSKYNGKIQVVRDLTWGTRIVVGGLTQSGGVIHNIWKDSLKKIVEKKPQIKNCLILGLGGGTSAKLVAQYWIGAEITGIDIDKKMIDLGKKYLSLNKIDINIKIQDAHKFNTGSYDLIIVDLYCGNKFPNKFEDEFFLANIKNLLNKNSIAIFNRLYGRDQKQSAMKFAKKLEKVFKKVDHIFPQANLEIICYN